MSNTLKTFLISLIIAPTVDSPRQLIARELCSDCSPVSPETLSARARPPVGPRPGAGLPSSVCRQLLLGTKPVLCTVHCTLCCTPAHGVHVSTPTPPERDWDRAADAILWPTQTLLLGIVQISGDRWFIKCPIKHTRNIFYQLFLCLQLKTSKRLQSTKYWAWKKICVSYI